MALQPGESPRLPHWGHIAHSSTGPIRIHGTTGKDSVDEAVDDITSFISVCGDREARQARIEIRPPGTVTEEAPARTIAIRDCDPDFGLTSDQVMNIRARLGHGPLAPRIDIVVDFARV